ncbi:MAG: PASTA domain-containing protein, partial [Negativicoccus succinicivorans]|nr:PASTA domain-containing protein [Negativicoccus succinicivorans]
TDVADTGTAEKAALEPLTLTRTEEGNIIVPDFTGRRLRDVLEWANQAQVGVVPEGEGVVITQTPLAGLTLEDTRQIRVQLAE